MRPIASDVDCPVYVLDPGEQVDMRNRIPAYSADDEFRPLAIYIKPDGSVCEKTGGDRPSICVLGVDQDGKPGYWQLSLAMLTPMIQALQELSCFRG